MYLVCLEPQHTPTHTHTHTHTLTPKHISLCLETLTSTKSHINNPIANQETTSRDKYSVCDIAPLLLMFTQFTSQSRLYNVQQVCVSSCLTSVDQKCDYIAYIYMCVCVCVCVCVATVCLGTCTLVSITFMKCSRSLSLSLSLLHFFSSLHLSFPALSHPFLRLKINHTLK